MDTYMTPTIPEDIHRGFLRLEYNTLNPILEQERTPFKLDLREPDYDVPYEYYGLENKITHTTQSGLTSSDTLL